MVQLKKQEENTEYACALSHGYKTVLKYSDNC